MSARTFPVLWPRARRDEVALMEELGCPREVPWEFIEEHQVGCIRNHDQTHEVLASRGGLAPEEMLAVIDPNAKTWKQRSAYWNMKPSESVPKLLEALRAWKAGGGK